MREQYHYGSQRMSFLTAIVLGGSATLITAILCGTALVGLGLRTLDKKTRDAGGFVKAVVESLPEIRDSLPAVLADVISDERRPDYVSNVKVSARLVADDGERGWYQPVIEIRNEGTEVISMLALRTVLANKNGDPISEWTEYAATPFAAPDKDLRGPLMPGAVRHVLTRRASRSGDRSVNCEVAELRVWQKTRPASPSSARADRLDDGERAMVRSQ